MNFNISELVSYDFFFFWVEKRLTGAVNIFSGVSKNRFRQTHHCCNYVEQLIILRFYNCMPTTSYFRSAIESKASTSFTEYWPRRLVYELACVVSFRFKDKWKAKVICWPIRSLTSLLLICIRTAKFVRWLQEHVISLSIFLTNEHPLLDQYPFTSDLQ